MKNAQITKKWAAPGIDHLSSFFWPRTSTSWVLIAVLDAPGDVLDPVRRGLARVITR